MAAPGSLSTAVLAGPPSRSYAASMTTVVLGHEPVIEAWLADRRAKGLDGRDEVWEGVLHVAPHEHGRNGIIASELQVLLSRPAKAAGLRAGGSFNLGQPSDFRVPDLGWHRSSPPTLYFDTAALVVEVLSPGDESVAKLPFYARRGVDEVWFVDPVGRTVQVHVLQDGAYTEREASALLGLTVADVVDGVDWP